MPHGRPRPLASYVTLIERNGMHWLAKAAARAGIQGAETAAIRAGMRTQDAWELATRTFGLSAAELARRLAPAVRVGVADLNRAEARVVRLVPERLARRHHVFPLREDYRTITLATSDPGDLEAEQEISFVASRRVVFELAPPRLIEEAIAAGYASDRGIDALLERADREVADAVQLVEEDTPEQISAHEVEATPIVQLTTLILHDAITRRASDVHIEPGDQGGVVRLRIDGVMRQHMQLPVATLNRVVSRIKVLGRLDIADRGRPQDGRARVQSGGRTYDLRISTVPTREAEKAVIRVLRPDTATSLPETGMTAPELARLRQLLGFRDGIVLVTGPTGSGKTTTLYAAIREVASGDVNVMTVEDPVEYELPGITQIQVEPKRGVTFPSALRAALRQDPDVIFVGEIRDLETADVAVQAAMTGHLVLATLHTNDAMSAVARLTDIGLDRPSIAASLRGALAQRLVRRLCSDCAQPIAGALTEEEERLAAQFGARPTRRAAGCANCAATGYRGRLPVDEVAVVTPAMAKQITQGDSAADLQRAAIAAGMRPLREVALDHVRSGETTLQEVERVLGEAGEPVVAPTSERAERMCVLLVDDDPIERKLARAVLERAGLSVSEAEDGVAALRLLGEGEGCAAVVTDLHMPNLDGEALLTRIRSTASMALLPVIVLTGSDDASAETRLMDAGADDYVRKPLDPPRFLARVKATLRRAGL